MANQLAPGQQLTENNQLQTGDAAGELIMQGDGNLVLYRSADHKPLWATGTNGTGATYAEMQTDGNLVVYDPNRHAFWATDTNGHPGASLTSQDTGDIVVGENGQILWHSNTAVLNGAPPNAPTFPLNAATGDNHVQVGRWMNSSVSLAADGTIRGSTHIWTTVALSGFHGSVVPMVLDQGGKAIWPPSIAAAKHQFGVDGTAIIWNPHDLTVNWSASVPSSIVAQAKALALVNFYDPKNMLLADVVIVGKIVLQILSVIFSDTGTDGSGQDGGMQHPVDPGADGGE